MNPYRASAFVLSTASYLLSTAASAAQPPDPTASDPNKNTAGGSNALFNLIGGQSNTAFGESALYMTTISVGNTAVGVQALLSDTTGSGNTAVGTGALRANTTAPLNTALGAHALNSNGIGTRNTASGFDSLGFNIDGNDNTADGASALGSNTGGSENTASGNFALYTNSTGNNNTASGSNALPQNSTGSDNVASGFQAMFLNDSGSRNVAIGVRSLYFSAGKGNVGLGYQAGYDTRREGSYNLAAGYDALHHNSTGSYNIALGYKAGDALTSGSNNIDIGSGGVAGESGVIRIGSAGTHAATYIAGISGVPLSGGATVVVNSAGQLGMVMSSARYKSDIEDLGERSARLSELRPVSFRYRNDPARELQYGLIAEEVEKIYPDLVVRGSNGEIESVQYHELIAMLLNELQKQQREIRRLQADDDAARAALEVERTELSARLDLLERQLRDSTVTFGQ